METGVYFVSYFVLWAMNHLLGAAVRPKNTRMLSFTLGKVVSSRSLACANATLLLSSD